MSVARTLGELRNSPFTAQRLGSRRVKDELRENLMARLREGSPIFSGIVGYDDTVVPQIVNAILSRHNFILLGLRGQAKSRILRALTALLDPEMPYVGCHHRGSDRRYRSHQGGAWRARIVQRVHRALWVAAPR
jgi:magnesium chelatase subunit I